MGMTSFSQLSHGMLYLVAKSISNQEDISLAGTKQLDAKLPAGVGLLNILIAASFDLGYLLGPAILVGMKARNLQRAPDIFNIFGVGVLLQVTSNEDV